MARYVSSLTGAQIEAALLVAKKVGSVSGIIHSSGAGTPGGVTALTKVSSITASSGSTQIPTAAAVWALVNPIAQEVNGINSLLGTGVI